MFGSRDGACVALQANAIVEVTSIDMFGKDVLPPSLHVGPYLEPGFNPYATGYDCIRLRERAPNGTVGDPTVLCARDAPLISFAGIAQLRCTSQGLTQDGLLLGVEGGQSPERVEGGVLSDGSTNPESQTAETPASGLPGSPSASALPKGGCSVAGGASDTAPFESLLAGSIVLAAGRRIGSRRNKRTPAVAYFP